MPAEPISIPIPDAEPVSGLWQAPANPTACLVLAHGAGAGMVHRSMAAIADGLAERGVATLRYQFPYMERGGKRVDPPPVAQATVRRAVAEARRRAGDLPLFAGGKSFGGRMTSQAQALAPLDGVRGLVFFAFPLHPAGKPSRRRAPTHLSEVTRADAVPAGDQRRPRRPPACCRAWSPGWATSRTLELAPDADHAFHVPAKTGRKDADVLAGLLDDAAAWIAARHDRS